MKRIVVASIAVVIAIAAFAFTNARSVKATCTDQLIWFTITNAQNYTCTDFASVPPTNVFGHPRTTANPLADLASFKKTQAQQVTIQCPAQSNIICTVGYDATLASNFVATVDGSGNPIWLPKTGLAPVCSTCKVQ